MKSPSSCYRLLSLGSLSFLLCAMPVSSAEDSSSGDTSNVGANSRATTSQKSDESAKGVDIDKLFAKDKGENKTLTKMLRGYVEKDTGNEPVSMAVNDAITEVIRRSREAAVRGKQVRHFSGLASKGWTGCKNYLNYFLDDRGFLSSVEASSLVLNKEVEAHHEPSACYGKQHWLDTNHDRIVTDVLEMASSRGVADGNRRQNMYENARKDLNDLVGDDACKRVNDLLAQCFDEAEKQAMPAEAEQARSWSEKDCKEKVTRIMSAGIARDATLRDIVKSATKYQHSKLVALLSSAVDISCSILEYSPTEIGTITEVCELFFDLATGGDVEVKVQNSLYMIKRMESRKASMMQQAYWAVNGYQIGVLTNNAALVSCCSALIRKMAGTEQAAKIMPGPGASDDSKTAGEPQKKSRSVSVGADQVLQ